MRDFVTKIANHMCSHSSDWQFFTGGAKIKDAEGKYLKITIHTDQRDHSSEIVLEVPGMSCVLNKQEQDLIEKAVLKATANKTNVAIAAAVDTILGD